MHGEESFADLRQGHADSAGIGECPPNETTLDENGACAAEVARHDYSCRIVAGDSGGVGGGQIANSVTLGFTLPKAYPSQVPPLFVLDGVPLDCLKAATLHLERVFGEECKPDSIGCLFQWTEWLRDCLQENRWPESEEEECEVVFD
jgi:hypothetical protein